MIAHKGKNGWSRDSLVIARGFEDDSNPDIITAFVCSVLYFQMVRETEKDSKRPRETRRKRVRLEERGWRETPR